MAPENEYLSILQQGAGLADVSLATAANSVVMVDPNRSYLTGLTGAAADGKVKVELGDDPELKGDYQFGFTVYNLTDDEMAEIAKLDCGRRYYNRTDEQLKQFAAWQPQYERA